MVPTSRRRLLAAGGTLALAGCLARDGDESPNAEGGTADGLPGTVDTALDPLPASVEGVEVQALLVIAPGDDSATGTSLPGTLAPDVGLQQTDLDRVATAMYADRSSDLVASFVGDFAADDVEDPSEAAVRAGDGRAIVASTGGSAWQAGIEAAEAAADDPETGVAAERPIEPLFEPIADAGYQIALPTVDAADVPDDAEIDPEPLAAIGVGMSTDAEAREQTVTYVAVFVEDASVDASVVEEIVRTDGDDVSPGDAEITTDGRRAVATVSRPLPAHQLPDNSPDLRFHFEYDSDAGVVSVEVEGEGSAEAGNLELRVDGQRVTPPWSPDATIAAGDSYEVEVPPLSLVEVVWLDPEHEDLSRPLGGRLVGAHDAFEESYDHRASRLTATYRLDETVDPGRFEVLRATPGGDQPETTALDERVDTLEPGTEIVFEDVDYGERVVIQISTDGESDAPTRPVYWFHAEPPGEFEVETRDDGRGLVYRGETEQPAEHYRVTVDDEPAATQFSDVADALSGGTSLELAVEPGDRIAVEYVGADEPLQVFHHRVRPDVEFSVDVGDGSVQVTHAGGESLEAERLGLLVHPGEPLRRADAFSTEFDTVESGASVTVEFGTDEEGEPVRPEIVVVLYDDDPISEHEVGGDASES